MIGRRTGKIVNISSHAGLGDVCGLVDYSTAKAGVIGFTMACAREVVCHGINVNSVVPGATATTELSWYSKDSNLALKKGLGDLGKPE